MTSEVQAMRKACVPCMFECVREREGGRQCVCVRVCVCEACARV